MSIEEQAAEFKKSYSNIKQEIKKVIVGHDNVIEETLTCLLTAGHALLEGVPGLGKTLLVRTLSQVLDVEFSRIQFTPDLMPADIIGTNIVVEDESGNKSFQFQKGPIFGNIILADEINRATPKTQSALLEAMQERSVSVARVRHQLSEPFLVLATQNPIEMEGTYPLPEAQLDRFFFKLNVESPDLDELSEIVDRTTSAEEPQPQKIIEGKEILRLRSLVRHVPVASVVKDYIGRLVLATHPAREYAPEVTRKYIRYGASPRAAQALILASKVYALTAGRYNISFADARRAMLPAMRHRIILNFEGEAEGISQDEILKEIMEKVPDTPQVKV